MKMVYKFAERQSFYSKKKLYAWIIFTFISLALTFIILFILTVVKKDMIYDLTVHEEMLTKEVSVLSRLKKEQEALSEITTQAQKKLTKVQKLGAISRNTPYTFLMEISDLIPDSIILTKFIFDTKNIELEGSADEVQGITHFMRELAESKLFVEPKLISMNRGEGREVKFVIRVAKA